MKTCKICSSRFAEEKDFDDEDTCPVCWEEIALTLLDFEEEEESEEMSLEEYLDKHGEL